MHVTPAPGMRWQSRVETYLDRSAGRRGCFFSELSIYKPYHCHFVGKLTDKLRVFFRNKLYFYARAWRGSLSSLYNIPLGQL